MTFNQNVIPLKKLDKFALCRGTMGPDDELIEYEQVGVAYLKPGSKTFRIKLWMFPNEQYFLSPSNDKSTAYKILSLEEFESQLKEKKASWQCIGKGDFVGLHIRMKFNLLSEEVFLCLFPDEKQAEEFYAAS
ncbi:hypothetical protein B9G69_004725 [Bdellovibrio sp. SKB1291214]|uniref:hypothetical protein n=1 Tax=unclassified Bdellovibrio TaxID=2633795 RepID=UPI000B51C0F5|nr:MULTISPECIES: hypothetical protein [unclassified Bdellovibrio]QDK44682.1 hypothetical protein DOM22_05655 [Bdellovibrio sp. ZAP7]UYL09877.1 hypothetical protein B9G69_004725 [Bdellovibrio sp. SKB1291214]